MLHIVTSLNVILIWLHLVGVGVLAYRFVKPYALSRAVAPVLVAVGGFFLEHFSGAGPLGWLWMLSTPLCLAGVVYQRQLIRSHWIVELYGAVAFFYTFLWRWTFPDIDGTVEKLSDLSFVAGYMPGSTLPPIDAWFPPYKFDFYYSLQHYAAALVGRWFGFDVGTATNLSFCILMSLIGLAAGEASRLFCRNERLAVLPTLAFLVGGSGAAVLGHFMVATPSPWFAMRFIGDLHSADQVSTEFGRWFVANAYSPGMHAPTAGQAVNSKPMVLPIETLGFVTAIAEYHATLAGFFILAIKLYALALLELAPHNRTAQAVMAATLPLSLVTNVWIFPLQVAILVAWIAYRYVIRLPPDWTVLVGAGLLGLTLCFPHLRGFGPQSAFLDTHIRLVPADEHTPPLAGLALLWPLAVVVLLGLLHSTRERIALLLAIIWTALFVISETIYIEDAYGGEFNRFNTTLKWWPHIYSGALLSLGAVTLASPTRLFRYASLITLLAVSLYAYDLGRDWVATAKPHKGRLDGAAWITQDLPQKALLDYLKAAPPGIVLERVPQGSYTYAPSFAMFSGHPALLGWWNGHEALWRGSRNDIAAFYEQTVKFYAGELQDGRDWLSSHNVRYVVWLQQDNIEPHTAFQRISDQIQPDFLWTEFYSAEKIKVGLWIRRDKR